MLVIYFSNEILDQVAEIQRVKCRLLTFRISTEFKHYASDMFEQFQARQKQYLMLKIFNEEIDIQ